MDPFTQRLIEKTRKRREMLDLYKSKDVESESRFPLHENNRSNCSSSHGETKKSDIVRHQLRSAVAESENSENVSRKDDAEVKEGEESARSEFDHRNNDRTKPCRFGRLAELATKIKEWEDEVDKPKHASQCVDETSKQSNKKTWAPKPMQAKTAKPQTEEKQFVWDRAIIKSLESQGYSLSQNESRLIYSFEKSKEESSPRVASPAKVVSSPSKRSDSDPDGCRKAEEVVPPKKVCGNSPRTTTNSDKDSAVLKKAAFFESHTKSSPRKTERDPAEMSIAERKALFERNGGEALVPKVAFSTPLPAKMMMMTPAKKVDAESGQGAKRSWQTDARAEIPRGATRFAADVESKVKMQRERFEKGASSDEGQSRSNSNNADVVMREKELEQLKSRWDRNKNVAERERSSIPEPPPMPSPPNVRSPPFRACSESAKSPVESPKKPETDDVRLYPSLSDVEESDNSDGRSGHDESSRNSNLYLNMTFSDILEAKKNEPTSSNDNSFGSESRVLSKMDEFLDNAFNELSSTDDGSVDDDGDDGAPSPPKMMKSSSFEYSDRSEGGQRGAESPVNLVHTVSLYRRQQHNSVNNRTPTPIKSIKRAEQEEELEEEGEEGEGSAAAAEEEEEVLVENKIQELLQEINKQQIIISQASQALNLCLSTIEFSGSGEQVESERLLLLSNHKRQACLNEIQRLKVENAIRPLGSNRELSDRGDVVIENVAIPLKRDAIRAMAAVESMQYLVCLIKSDERVLATPAVPATRENLKSTAAAAAVLCFPGRYKLENLFSDFKVTIEVYNMELSKEMLPHEVKYHIGQRKDKKLLTPIKSKRAESKLVMPHVQSPAGPNAVRSSNFHLCGYVVFSLREISRTNWTLNKVPYTSPLDGSFSMKIQSELQLDTEFRGFLTMFDDISGFGAWHRRWCLLSGHTLSYWKYPDDETRKIPVGSMDLRGVVTESVGLVSRDICARLHTFLVETTRPRQAGDTESLVLRVDGDVARMRHLLSADSKEEMLAWCRKLNSTLALLRSWRCTLAD